MTDLSKREIDSWIGKQLSEGDVSEVDLTSEEARVVRKWDMVQQGIKPNESLSVKERETLRDVVERS
ncbi:hypothetical protein [Halalkalicoccus subterraneus]|uniref:hypothetical protein n=1 Tax=Halalkalicoccus subterraneus TaxID=2675002 RepID=UPI000EFD7746|nr:hypothetical protein [Halalkalicoccus subterraneus]